MIDYSSLLSEKVQEIKPSGIRKFSELAAEMGNVISLGVGEPDFQTPWAIRQAGIESLERGRTHYSPNAGFRELKQEIDRYLERGTMYVLEEEGVKAECVVTDEGNGVLELKNIAVQPDFQGRGYGKALLDFLVDTYAGAFAVLQVGTGESPATLSFYESCGFCRHHRIKNFFTDFYDHPILECGVQLVDMIYLQRKL